MGCTGSRRSGRTSGREDHPLPAGQLAALALKGTPVYSWPPWPLEGTPVYSWPPWPLEGTPVYGWPRWP